MNDAQKSLEIESLRELLVPTHLYYDAGTRSLKTRAFAEIITKILFLQPEKKARLTEISAEAARIVGVRNLIPQDVQGGLEFLKDKGVVIKQGKFWFLKSEESERIKIDLSNAERRIDHVLDKHFGTKIDRATLRAWFKNAATAFFGKFGEVWAKRLKREAAKLPDAEQIKNIITTSIGEYHLEKDQTHLIDGFNSFLRDHEDIAVEQQIWSFAQAMLSARLVTAATGPDPLSISEFKSSSLLLDTNVLFVAALEKSRLASAFSALAASIKHIEAAFYVTRETEDEYESVVARKRGEALRAIGNYSLDVIEDARDPFLKTALARGCVDKESFTRFFDSIQYAPDKIGDEKIVRLEDPEVAIAAEAGRKNTKKQTEIAAEWKAQRHYEKSKHSTIHDAALDSVLECLRGRGTKSWIISSDGPMQTLAARWAGAKPPAWIGIDTLVQILAISSGGPGHKPENFIPLFGTIIREDLHASDRVYTLEDLDALLDLDERAKELSTEDIQQFAAKMRRLRMAGKSKNDSELQLEIRRTFQRKKMTADDEMKRLEGRVEEMGGDLKKEAGYSAAVMTVLIDQIYCEEKRRRRWWLFAKGLAVLIIGAALTYFGIKTIMADNPNLGYFVLSLGVAECLIPLFVWILPEYRKIDSEAQKTAKEKATKAISEAKK